LPPVTTLAPFLTASAMCASTFSTALVSIKGPITAPGANPSGNLHRAGVFKEAGADGIVLESGVTLKRKAGETGMGCVLRRRGRRVFAEPLTTEETVL